MTQERDDLWNAVYAAAYVAFLTQKHTHDTASATAHYFAVCCADTNADTRARIKASEAERNTKP